MDNDKFHIFTLNNGQRCVFSRKPGVAYIGVAVNAGSRDEARGKEGLAHFVEHTIFKGTAKRKSWHISARMESVGGELNAYTSKEETVIYTVAPHGYADRATELLSDIIADARFPENELEREKTVVIDEINSYLDNPSESLFDDFEDLIYAGSRLGHNILGSPETVMDLTGSECRRFLETYYRPDNMAIYCAADISEAQAEKMLARHFGALHRDAVSISRSQIRTVPPVNPRFDEVRDRGLHIAHTLLGCRMVDKYDPRRYALQLLNNYLGGPAMNSRLNRELREKHGYVYSVDSMVYRLSDCGLFLIYFGCDKSNLSKCRTLIERVLRELADKPMKSTIFEAARRQYLGQIQVADENAESRASSMGRTLLGYGKVIDSDDVVRGILETKPEDLRQMAELIVTQGLSRLTIC